MEDGKAPLLVSLGDGDLEVEIVQRQFSIDEGTEFLFEIRRVLAYVDQVFLLELVGVQFISIGLLGELLTRTYFESQGKTPYAVRTTVNLDPPVQRRAA